MAQQNAHDVIDLDINHNQKMTGCLLRVVIAHLPSSSPNPILTDAHGHQTVTITQEVLSLLQLQFQSQEVILSLADGPHCVVVGDRFAFEMGEANSLEEIANRNERVTLIN